MKKLYLLLILAAFLAGCGGSGVKVNTDLVPVKSNDKWGYVNLEGNFVINPQFSDADWFVDGLALVQNAEGKYGYINEKGEYVINAQFKYALPFSEDLACVVSDGGAPKYIDKKGEVKFELAAAAEAGSFHNGLAVVKNAEGKYGYVDKTGTMVVNFMYDEAMDFTEGLAAVMNSKKAKDSSMVYEWGFINEKGEVKIPMTYKAVSPFFNGMACVTADDKTWGYLNTKGEFAINPQYDRVKMFGKDLAAVEQGDTWGFIDKQGKFVVNPQFDLVKETSGKFFPVKQADKWGYVDGTGKFIIPAQFDEASSFIGKIAVVRANDKYGFVDETGKYLVNPQFDMVNVAAAQYVNFGVFTGTVQTDKITPPETIAESFLKFYLVGKYDEAKEFGTTATGSFLDSEKEKNKEDTVAKPPVKIEKMKCEIKEDTAHCKYLVDGQEDEITCVKENNKWLVHMPKEQMSIDMGDTE